jgi:hypothetical protein
MDTTANAPRLLECNFCTAIVSAADPDTQIVTIAPTTLWTSIGTYNIKVKRKHILNATLIEEEDYEIIVVSCEPVIDTITHAVGANSSWFKMYPQSDLT